MKEKEKTKCWEKPELLRMYETAWSYHYFITCCPEVDYRYIELMGGISDLMEQFRDICVDNQQEGALKDFGRQGYWFSRALGTLLNEPKNDKIYEVMKQRFFNLLEAKKLV